MLCLISYHNVRKLSRQSVLTPVSFTAHGHMFALPSFSEPIASFGRLKPRVSGDENVDTGGYSKMFYLETTRIRLKMKSNVCFFFLTPPPPPFPPSHSGLLEPCFAVCCSDHYPPSWIQTFFIIVISFLAGNLIIGGGEVLEINTTAPSIVNNNCPNCNYNASHENRSSSSSHGEHLAAVIRFSGNIEFRNGSTVQVFGKYGLSITSQNGHILIETDINMTCTEMVLDERCLGGFTQSSIGPLEDVKNSPKFVYKGKRRCFYLPFSYLHLVCSCFHTYFLGGGYKV